MNEYIGKVCPYCKTPFIESDEIVVCSICDMPHHKDCWIENQGCTTFGCMGTIKAVDGSPTSVTATSLQYNAEAVQTPTTQTPTVQTPTAEYVYCAHCGTQNASTSLFCCKCGSRLQHFSQRSSEADFAPAGVAPQDPPDFAQAYRQSYRSQHTSQDMDSEYAAYIGVKSEYYVPVFNKLKIQNKKNAWNWCAYLFAPYWFIYRKMYAYGVATFAAAFALSFLGQIGFIASFGGKIAIGILGNHAYMRQIEKNMQNGRDLTEPYKSQHISKTGGVNTTATILAVACFEILTLIFA